MFLPYRFFYLLDFRLHIKSTMKQAEIIQKLSENHEAFIDFIYALNKEEFEAVINNKWSAGQQLEHIYLSLKPLTQVLQIPRFLLRLIFGKANRPSKKYEVLVEKYKDKLANGGRATGSFIPALVLADKKEVLIKKIQHAVYKLTSLISHYKEEELDSLILPHPLLGKLTIREMLYFTIYHVEHHEAITKRNLGVDVE